MGKTAKRTAEHFFVTEKMKDKRDVMFRALHPEDKYFLLDVWHHLSPLSVYYRFFGSNTENITDAEMAFFVDIDFINHVAILASVTEGKDEVPVGVGRYIVPNPDAKPVSAELAFAVDEPYQGLGIGTLLMKHLTSIARDYDFVEEFTAYVLAENEKMLGVFAHCGLPMTRSMKDFDSWEVKLKIK